MAVARVVLSVVALLSVAAYTGAATSCENSTFEESEVEAALSVINEARSKVYHGEQLNGESGEKLPAAAKVTTVEWDCSLEEVALQDMKDRCNKKKPNVQANLTYVRRSEISKVHLERTLTYYLIAINYTMLTNITGSPTYNDEADLILYANFIRDKTSKVGCARHTCNPNDKRPTYVTLCLTNQPALKTGEVIYEVDSSSSACPGKPYMNDVVRRAFLNRHNELRSQLATGTAVNGQNGGKTRPAKNMTKLVYDCELEKVAYERARLCENFTPEDPKTLKENSFNFTKNLNRPFEEYAKLATQVWWSELSRTGLNQTLNLFYTHLGISHFAKIGSDLTTKVGCGIYNCTSTINAVCLYETGLKHAYRLYAPAVKPCRECGDEKCANGLCPATVEGAKL